MKSLCTRRVSVWNPDTLKEIVRFVHEVHPVFFVSLWMHFVNKMDNLFRSIRVSDENSSVTKALHHFKLITTPDFLCVHYAPFKATSSTFNPFWHNLIFLMRFLICFELNDPEIEKHYKWTLKRLKVGKVSSFHPHSMCKKVERFRQKLDALLVQTGESLSKYQGFGWKLIYYKGRHFIFLNLLQL